MNFEEDLQSIENRIWKLYNNNKLWTWEIDKCAKYCNIYKSTKTDIVGEYCDKRMVKPITDWKLLRMKAKGKPRKTLMDNLLDNMKIMRMSNGWRMQETEKFGINMLRAETHKEVKEFGNKII